MAKLSLLYLLLLFHQISAKYCGPLFGCSPNCGDGVSNCDPNDRNGNVCLDNYVGGCKSQSTIVESLTYYYSWYYTSTAYTATVGVYSTSYYSVYVTNVATYYSTTTQYPNLVSHLYSCFAIGCEKLTRNRCTQQHPPSPAQPAPRPSPSKQDGTSISSPSAPPTPSQQQPQPR